MSVVSVVSVGFGFLLFKLSISSPIWYPINPPIAILPALIPCEKGKPLLIAISICLFVSNTFILASAIVEALCPNIVEAFKPLNVSEFNIELNPKAAELAAPKACVLNPLLILDIMASSSFKSILASNKAFFFLLIAASSSFFLSNSPVKEVNAANPAIIKGNGIFYSVY